MRQDPTGIRLSATDLASHLGCRHLTTLELARTRGEMTAPSWHHPRPELLRERGLRHENEYLEHLASGGVDVVRLEGDPEASAAAMAAGAGAIVQAVLQDEGWYGRADVLLRVATPSVLGDWSYEVVDTKLSRETRAGTILQLCLYTELVGRIQGLDPVHVHVVPPGIGFEPEGFRFQDYAAYFRLVRRKLREAIDQEPATNPEPVAHCDICRWWTSCRARWREDDHLSLVAGITKLQRRELQDRGIDTLEALAGLPDPLPWRPSRGVTESYVAARDQARVQLEGRRRAEPIHEILPVESGRGLARLPQPSPGDVYFDIEGDPFVGTAGLEYLFGWITPDDASEPVNHERWALDQAAEKPAFEGFVDFVMERRERYPDLHVYHYAPYEPGALKRLMGRHATREDEIDRLLRAGVLVDLYRVVRQGIRASVEKYSIKDLEPFYGFEREMDLRDASRALREVEARLELSEPLDSSEEGPQAVRRYNREDCLSTLKLHAWLEETRSRLEQQNVAVPRPEAAPEEAPETVSEQQARVQELWDRLLDGVPDDLAGQDPEQHERWLVAHLLDYFRREDKATWWEYFRLGDLDEDELLEEKAGLAGLEFEDRVGGTEKCPVHRYRFPPQEGALHQGSELHAQGPRIIGTVARFDPQAGSLDIKKRGDTRDLHPTAVFEFLRINPGPLAEAVFRLGSWLAQGQTNEEARYRAARDLLQRRPPRLGGDGPLRRDGESALDAARRLVLDLDHSVLALQGPPGSGKTYTGAHMMCDLVRAGRRVGVTALGHKVIRNLLDETAEVAQDQGLEVRFLQKVSGSADSDSDPVRETTDNTAVDEAIDEGAVDVVGGTAWLWAREELAGAVDVLFIDEAGQVPLAYVLAVAQATKSIVLLGDQQQLEQPQQGTHPEGTAASALEHVLAGHATMPPDKGLFLDRTWRLHPSICRFTSELFYENRLEARPGLESQGLTSGSFAGAGLWLVPLPHRGNQSSSPEEADCVARLVEELLRGEPTWQDGDGRIRPLTLEDILIVAPYNAQVAMISERLAQGARVGTVDRFQGQEAAVVIYSLTTSSPEDAPRGMDFLYSLNRLNVATSRARCACILVADPSLLEPGCRSPAQMRLANAFCRYAELATLVEMGS